MHSLKINQLTKNYGKNTALDEVTLEIEPGTFGLLGPNGAGKTTFMRILTTLIPPTSGEISFGERKWTDPQEVRKLIGYLPQRFSLYKNITVREVLQHIAILKGVEGDIRQVVDVLIEKVNLTEHCNKKMGKLSGGMVRRVGIAQAILGDPKIIVVDEPTAGLDPEERIRFRKLLRQLSRELIVIISTHIVEDIEATCDNGAILYKGHLIEQGNIGKLGELARGKVWTMMVTQNEFYDLSERWNVISCQRVNNQYLLRILADQPPFRAVLAEPTLEDGYLLAMKREAL